MEVACILSSDVNVELYPSTRKLKRFIDSELDKLNDDQELSFETKIATINTLTNS